MCVYLSWHQLMTPLPRRIICTQRKANNIKSVQDSMVGQVNAQHSINVCIYEVCLYVCMYVHTPPSVCSSVGNMLTSTCSANRYLLYLHYVRLYLCVCVCPSVHCVFHPPAVAKLIVNGKHLEKLLKT